MAYSTTNQPRLLVGGFSGAYNIWVYASPDAAALVRAAGYFTDGYNLGMRKGDLVMQVDNDATPIAMQLMTVATATAASVDLSDGTAITATNT